MSLSQWNTSTAILYLWHLADGLTHLLIESTYIYGCFNYSIPIDISPQQHPHASSPAPHEPHYFLNRKDRLYGNTYGTTIPAKIWQEYARADSRYAGIDITTLSLEIVTVFLAGPLALYVAESIRRDVEGRGRLAGGTWFWAGVLAVGELYGGCVFKSSQRPRLYGKFERVKVWAERVVGCLIFCPNGLLGIRAFVPMILYICKSIVERIEEIPVSACVEVTDS